MWPHAYPGKCLNVTRSSGCAELEHFNYIASQALFYGSHMEILSNIESDHTGGHNLSALVWHTPFYGISGLDLFHPHTFLDCTVKIISYKLIVRQWKHPNWLLSPIVYIFVVSCIFNLPVGTVCFKSITIAFLCWRNVWHVLLAGWFKSVFNLKPFKLKALQ